MHSNKDNYQNQYEFINDSMIRYLQSNHVLFRSRGCVEMTLVGFVRLGGLHHTLHRDFGSRRNVRRVGQVGRIRHIAFTHNLRDAGGAALPSPRLLTVEAVRFPRIRIIQRFFGVVGGYLILSNPVAPAPGANPGV